MSIQTDDFSPARRATSRVADAPLDGPVRVVEPAVSSPHEDAIERALRPKDLDEYVGQLKAREQLEIFIGAARKRGEALDQRQRGSFDGGVLRHLGGQCGKVGHDKILLG